MRSNILTPFFIVLLLIEAAVVVSGAITFTTPNDSTVWTPGSTYDIVVKNDKTDKVKAWQVSLVVIGGKCSQSDFCLQDGIVANIANNYDGQRKLQYTVPKDLAQYGKAFQVQFSNDGTDPVYESSVFTIERSGTAAPKPGGEADTKTQEPGESVSSTNTAAFVLPQAIVSTFVLGGSCLFAFLMM